MKNKPKEMIKNDIKIELKAKDKKNPQKNLDCWTIIHSFFDCVEIKD